MGYYFIDGYWKDTGEEFTEYMVSETHDMNDDVDDDDDVFYYGMPMSEAIESIGDQHGALEFVITNVYK